MRPQADDDKDVLVDINPKTLAYIGKLWDLVPNSILSLERNIQARGWTLRFFLNSNGRELISVFLEDYFVDTL